MGGKQNKKKVKEVLEEKEEDYSGQSAHPLRGNGKGGVPARVEGVLRRRQRMGARRELDCSNLTAEFL